MKVSASTSNGITFPLLLYLWKSVEVRFGISSRFGGFAFVPNLGEVCFLHILLVFLHKIIPDYMQKNEESAVNVVLFHM